MEYTPFGRTSLWVSTICNKRWTSISHLRLYQKTAFPLKE